jgi:hypothetical protein
MMCFVWLSQLIDLRGQDEIRFGQSIHGVRPGRDLDLAPSEENVGMMALLFGQFANPIYKSQSRLEIGEFVGANQVMLVDDCPLPRFRQLTMNFCKLVSLQRRLTAAAGDAISVG